MSTAEAEKDPRGTGWRGPRLYLTGFMAAGKTAVGSALAENLGRVFCDLDAVIEQEAGETVREIFARRGEAAFRDLEHECLGRTAELAGAVIATGGGTMSFARNRELIRRLGVSVWLDPPFDTLLARLRRSVAADRPLYGDENETRALYHRRLDAYRMSDLRIEPSSGESAPSVAARIAHLLRERRCAI